MKVEFLPVIELLKNYSIYEIYFSSDLIVEKCASN